MIYRLLRWLIVAALAALIAYVLFRSGDVAATEVSARCAEGYDQIEVIAATPCAPCSQAVFSESADRPPIP